MAIKHYKLYDRCIFQILLWQLSKQIFECYKQLLSLLISISNYDFTFQWQFLARDEGEVNIEADAGWMEDEGMGFKLGGKNIFIVRFEYRFICVTLYNTCIYRARPCLY
jgi:hypothetical protein